MDSRASHALPDLPTPDEAGLVAALQRGDDEAFRTLVRDHGAALLVTARRMLGDEDEARDAVQEAFLAAFRAVANFESKSRLATWLHRIAVNAALMKLRTRRRRAEHSIDDLLPRFLADGHHQEPPCPWSEQAQRLLESAESHAIVWQAIDSLPAAYREVVVLRDVEGLSTEESAAQLGITANAIKIRLHRARQALRTLLHRHFEELDR